MARHAAARIVELANAAQMPEISISDD